MMSPIVRELTEDDLSEAYNLAATRPGFGTRLTKASNRGVQLNLWRRLLHRAAIRSGVSEDPDRSQGHRLLVFGIGAFVRADWACQFRAAPFPFVGQYILDRLLDGNDEILLSDSEVRKANSFGGLHHVILVSGWQYLTSTRPFDLKIAAIEAFLHAYRGFRINEFITEVLEGPEADFSLSNDTWRPRKRFPIECRGENPADAVLISVGIDVNEAREPGRETSVLAPLFVWPEIRFAFTPQQQVLLSLAASQITDKEIAKTLKIGPDAVGRRFDRIYRRVEALQHPFHPVFPAGTEAASRRRLLLDYLGRNIHELRPHAFRPKQARIPRQWIAPNRNSQAVRSIAR